MTQQFNRMPDVNTPLQNKGALARGWYLLWQGLWQGQPTGPVAAVSVTASPFTYVASQGGTLILNGGTTTQVKFSRDGSNFYVTGLTAGMFPLSQGDQLVISYSGALPTATWVPR